MQVRVVVFKPQQRQTGRFPRVGKLGDLKGCRPASQHTFALGNWPNKKLSFHIERSSNMPVGFASNVQGLPGRVNEVAGDASRGVHKTKICMYAVIYMVVTQKQTKQSCCVPLTLLFVVAEPFHSANVSCSCPRRHSRTCLPFVIPYSKWSRLGVKLEAGI